jgi:chlorophyllide a reductase subunit Y
LGNKGRFDRMRGFFDGVGTAHAAGVWEAGDGAGGVPQERPEFKAETRRQVIKIMKRRKAEEMLP